MDSKIKISIIGDIMCEHSQILALQGDYDFPFKDVKDNFKNCDLLICNLETPLSRDCSKWAKEKYSFCASEEFAIAVSKLNKNIIFLTANNHCLDRGVDGLRETIEILDDNGIMHTGTQLNRENNILLSIEGIKIAIANYTYGTNAFNNKQYLKSGELSMVNLLQPQELSNSFYKKILSSRFIGFRIIRKICSKFNLFQINQNIYERESCRKGLERSYLRSIRRLKKENDIVIDCLHIGGQYNKEPNNYTRKTVKKTIKSGADIISCNHEHVIHPIEKKERQFINYSLGNFLGVNGVTTAPFDKYSDVSVGINIYIDKITKELSFSYSLFKTLEKEGKCYTVALFDLIQREPMNDYYLQINNHFTEYLQGKIHIPAPEYWIGEDNNEQK